MVSIFGLSAALFRSITEKFWPWICTISLSDKKTTYLYSSVSPAQKNRLFAAYKDYVVLMRNLEQVVKRYKKNNLAAYELTRLFGKDAKTNPWQMEYKEQADHAHYASFLANKPADKSKH